MSDEIEIISPQKISCEELYNRLCVLRDSEVNVAEFANEVLYLLSIVNTNPMIVPTVATTLS